MQIQPKEGRIAVLILKIDNRTTPVIKDKKCFCVMIKVLIHMKLYQFQTCMYLTNSIGLLKQTLHYKKKWKNQLPEWEIPAYIS